MIGKLLLIITYYLCNMIICGSWCYNPICGSWSIDQFMAKLGNIEVLMDQNEGDIRSKYSFVNAYWYLFLCFCFQQFLICAWFSILFPFYMIIAVLEVVQDVLHFYSFTGVRINVWYLNSISQLELKKLRNSLN